jgi:Na+/H+ antiporter NhaD/arsenite permease-like protein
MKQKNRRSKLHDHSLFRFIVLVVAAFLAECCFLVFLKKPFPWVALVPATVPLWVAVFVLIPMLRRTRR